MIKININRAGIFPLSKMYASLVSKKRNIISKCCLKKF